MYKEGYKPKNERKNRIMITMKRKKNKTETTGKKDKNAKIGRKRKNERKLKYLKKD